MKKIFLLSLLIIQSVSAVENLSKAERKAFWQHQNNLESCKPYATHHNFWGQNQNTPWEPAYVSSLIKQFQSLLGTKNSDNSDLPWFKELTFFLAFSDQLSEKQKNRSKDILFQIFCARSLKQESDGSYRFSPQSLKALQAINNTSDDWEEALRQLPEYEQIQEEFKQILTRLIQKSKQKQLQGHLEEFRKQFSVNRTQELRKEKRKASDEKEKALRYKCRNSNQPSIYDKPLSNLFDEEKN